MHRAAAGPIFSIEMSGTGSYSSTCAECGCYVGLGNLPRDYHGIEVCDDCFTALASREDPFTSLTRYLGALRERVARLFRGP